MSGACCENVIGFVGLPVGIAGPLLVDGEKVWIPMATMQSTLVPSTNRGCNAILQGTEYMNRNPTMALRGGVKFNFELGVQTSIMHDGMTRAPLVQFPSTKEAKFDPTHVFCFKFPTLFRLFSFRILSLSDDKN